MLIVVKSKCYRNQEYHLLPEIVEIISYATNSDIFRIL